MKIPSQRGVALVLVLCFLLLISAIILGFFASVSTENVTSQASAQGMKAKELADSTVQIVIGAIRQATTNPGWASQPGMIRTYDNAGNPTTNYKLYSSATMMTNGAMTVASTPSTSGNNVDDYDPDWSSNSALWTDLNSPVRDATGTLNYPIIDGNNLSTSSGVSTYQPINGQSLQGFSINNPPLSNHGTTINPVPMPVQWLYQLRDGTLAAATANGTNTVNVTGASATNPIVARIAFWTDDETSKINVNTACGDLWSPSLINLAPPNVSGNIPMPPPSYTPPGSFWDIPRCLTYYDFCNLAYCPPAQNEFQRYPGHPATVYLSAVFPTLTRDQLFSLVPRINGGGSEGGTVLATQAVPTKANRLYASLDELLFAPTNVSNLRSLNDTSTSILDKATLRRAKFFLTANSRAPEVNVFDQPRIAMWPIDSDVITKEAAGKLSPRGTAFDALIAFCSHLGPLGSGNDYCLQRQANGYMSQTADLSITRNTALYSYLQGLMGAQLPGFGSNLSAKFGADTNQIATEIFDYIRCTNPSDDNIAFLNTPVNTNPSPANNLNCYTPSSIYSSSPLSWGDVSGNVLLQANPYHDFIAPGVIGTTQGFGSSVTISELGLCFICCGQGDNTPGDGGPSSQYTVFQNNSPTSTSTTSKIYSNFPPIKTPLPTITTISNNAFFHPASGSKPPGYATITSDGFIPANWNYNLPTYDWANDPSGTKWTGLQNGQRRIKAIFLINPYTVSPGYSTMHMDLGIEVQNLDGLSVNGIYSGSGNKGSISLGFPHDALVVMSNVTLRTPMMGLNGYFALNGYYSPSQTLPEGNSPIIGDTKTPIYPFISAPFTVDTTQASMVVTGGNNIAVKLWHLSPSDKSSGAAGTIPSSSTLVQTINVDLTKLGAWQFPTLFTPTNNNLYHSTLPTQWNYAQSNNNGIANYSPQTEWDFSQSGIDNQGTYKGRLYAVGSFDPIINFQNDSVRTLVPGYPTDPTGVAGDFRLLAAQKTVSAAVFVPHRLLKDLSGDNITPIQYQSFPNLYYNGFAMLTGNYQGISQDTEGSNFTACPFAALVTSTPPKNVFNNNPNNLKAVQTGDFDNGMGQDMDGPYINKPDTGFAYVASTFSLPYFGFYQSSSSPLNFSPNRQIPSPGMFGSLPVGVQRNLPWQTLLFRPQPTHPDGVPVPDVGMAPITGGPYAGLVADHLLMDFFWMPVVQPYAISEPFSTAGKINLNYQIAPFTYINRETAIDALLKSQRIMAMPNVTGANNGWKEPWSYSAQNAPAATDYRSDVNLSDTTGTLRQFQEKFAAGDLFRSASQICDIYLTPASQSWTTNANATTFWAAHQPTGDNTRERPYTDLYGCLTTKSNTYTVHFRVQTLQKIPTTPANQWVDGVDVVSSETRGSSLIERFVDPGNPNLPDFTKYPADPQHTLSPYYNFRVLGAQKFAP